MSFFTDTTAVKFTCIDKWFSVSSVFMQAGGLTIRWYGVIIAFGLTLAVLFGGRTAYKWKIDINKMIDVLIYGCFGGIIGARAYYVLSEWDYYGKHLAEVVKIWHGGLAIYGGLIGGLLAAFIVCKVEKINVLNLLDICGMSFLIGQGIGRWGNFANQEAFGINTSLPWGMYSEKTNAYLTSLVNSGTDLSVDPAKPVHPTFLYESIWCLLGFLVLYIICKKFRKFSGQIFLCYGVWYGLERAIVEGLRTDSLYIGSTNIRVSQLLSVVLVIVCSILLTIFTVKFTLHPKPIEGIDFFNEIPLYRYNKKAADARKAADELIEKAEKAEREAEEAKDSENAGKLEEKAKLAREKADEADKKAQEAKRIAEEDAARIAAKKAKRKKNKNLSA